MESVNEFVKQYMPEIIGAGIGGGLFFGFISVLSGYMLSKVQSFFDTR